MSSGKFHVEDAVGDQLSQFFHREFLRKAGLTSQDTVREALPAYVTLAKLTESDEFVKALTHAGNIARDGLKPNSSEPFSHKIAHVAKTIFQRQDSTELDYAEESHFEIMKSLPAVLNGILESDAQENPDSLFKDLKSKGIIGDGAYRFSPRLIGSLRNLAFLVAVEK